MLLKLLIRDLFKGMRLILIIVGSFIAGYEIGLVIGVPYFPIFT